MIPSCSNKNYISKFDLSYIYYCEGTLGGYTMGYKIIIDSCGELTEELKKDGHFESVPLELEVDGYLVTDDASFDQKDFLKRVKESKECPKSSCPSPERYMQDFEGEEENVYVVTLSSKLSGSYNSAQLAKNLYLEEHENKNIYVFDSCSASIGETILGMKIKEFEEAGMKFDEIVEAVEAYKEDMNTFFVLETLDTLKKNGRLSNLKAFVAGALNIKPVMGSTNDGMICQLGQARGMNKALDKMIESVLEKTNDTENRILAIAHCNCLDRAIAIKDKIQKLAKFQEIFIVDTAGVSSMYANDGGIIMAI